MLLSAYPPPESPTSSAFCSHVFRLLYPLHHVVMLLYCLAVPVQRAQVAADRPYSRGRRGGAAFGWRKFAASSIVARMSERG